MPAPVRWTCDDYHAMGSAGLFEGRKLILIDGEILEMSAPAPPHDIALGLADYLFKALFGPSYFVRIQMGMVLGINTDPLPDLIVVPGSPRDYTSHPTTALLVLEVSDTSLAYDTGDKANLYAAAGILDYWVVDVTHRRLYVFRNPKPDAGVKYGHAYFHQTVLGPADAIAPLAAPQSPVTAADLLP
jgi:Uma2 family endonuclease